MSVSIHIGNSDIVAEYACRDSTGLMGLLAQIKGVPTVGRIVWSEEVSVMEREKKTPIITTDKYFNRARKTLSRIT